MTHHVLIVGGGSAGITTAALLRRKGITDISVLEPSTSHYYQPAWTLVGGGVVKREKTVRPTASVMPAGVRWIQDRAKSFDPVANRLDTERNGSLTYDFLVVAPGLQLDWDAIPGLREGLETPNVSSIYSFEGSTKTWEMLESTKDGDALFTCPPMPIKCAGAPQKIAYLMADHLRRKGLQGNCRVRYATALPVIFGVKEYADRLVEIAARANVDVLYQHQLSGVDPAAREASFTVTRGEETTTERLPYTALHVTPPQSAPDFIKQSPLAGESPAGWMAVDKNTLRHVRYENVFGLGDVTDTPNAKTGAAIRHQAPILADNLCAQMEGRALPGSYGGYGACPLVTAYGKMLLAEFDYTGKPTPTLPIDTMRERYSMWLLKRYGLPWFYWNRMLRGRC